MLPSAIVLGCGNSIPYDDGGGEDGLNDGSVKCVAGKTSFVVLSC